jgi:hypothetical protein
MNRIIFGSVTRISNLAEGDYEVRPLPREEWEHAQYVVGKMIGGCGQYGKVELSNGRLVDLILGDLVMGALGVRAATLETCGDWELVGDDLIMDQMTPAGLFGKETSRSYLLPALPRYGYVGHVWVNGRPVGMTDCVETLEPRKLDTPTILIIGTSMSAGKTTTARVLIRQLTHLGLRVVGAKLTGAGRYRDVLSMHDAGADRIFDFVDVGLPSTVRPRAEYEERLDQLLSRIAGVEADVLVVEIGASPMEPYNGESAVERIKSNIKMSVLCASDPYAVKGVVDAFELTPDLVSGPCTNTEASIALVKRLVDLPTINILADDSPYVLQSMMAERLGLKTTLGSRISSQAMSGQTAKEDL